MNSNKYKTYEQIGNFLAQLPSDHLLQQDLMTEDQLDEWQQSRETQLLIADCWKAKFLDGYPDLLTKAFDEKRISKHKYHLTNVTVNRYKAQWELIKEAEKYLQLFHSEEKSLSDNALFKGMSQNWINSFKNSFSGEYPFRAADELFEKTVREEVDGRFLWCHNGYYDVTIKSWRQAIKQLIGILEREGREAVYPELNSIEVDKYKKNFGWRKVDFSWLDMTLYVSQLSADQDPMLRKKLREYNSSLSETFKLTATASLKLPGFAWVKGKKVKASETGGVYREI